MPGIFSRLGSFAASVIKRVVEAGRSIGEAVEFFKPMVPTVTASEVAAAYGKVVIEEKFKGAITDLNPRSIVPDSLHIATDIPFKRPYAYKVVAYGRYTAGTIRKGEKVGGRFAHEEWDLTTSRKLTKEEAMEMAKGRLGKTGGSPIMEIYNVEVVAAYFREEE